MKKVFLAVLALACTACSGSGDTPISISHAWARATPPDSSVAAVYLEMTARRADRLLSVSTAAAASAEVHITQEQAGMSSMHHLEGLELPQGATQRFAPGGTHLMLMGLQQPLRDGEKFAVTLHFEHAGDVPVDVEVVSTTAER
jgi:copper(I)-binding protein